MQDQASPNKALDSLRLKTLLKRAGDGDESTVDLIRELLEILPAGSRTLGGDLAHEAEQALVRAITGTNVAQREALNRKLTEMRRDLEGSSPQSLERLLVERVVLCWLHVHHADAQYAYAQSVTLGHGEYLQRQQERAQRRYLAAIKSLAVVRRLALPIKLAVTVAGARENQPRPACRRPVEVGHTDAVGPGQNALRRKTVKRNGRSRSRQ